MDVMFPGDEVDDAQGGLHKVSEAVPVVDDLAPTRTVSVLLRAALVALTTPPLRFSLEQNQRMRKQE